MGGASLAHNRRKVDSYFRDLYFVGQGLDIGAGGDPLGALLTADDFPLAGEIAVWDYTSHGDAQELTSEKVGGITFDFIHASHVLEHVRNPDVSVRAWLNVLRPGGHLIILVPDFTMYERRVWPPHFNTDHRSCWDMLQTFEATLPKWSPERLHWCVSDLATLVRAQWLNRGWDASLPFTQDQTVSPGVECAIEIILQRL